MNETGKLDQADFRRFAVIVLAAGSSRRFGKGNKLLHDIAGRPILSHVLQPLSNFSFAQHLVVTSGDGEIEEIARRYGFDPVLNADHLSGMGGSIATGVNAVNKTTLGCFVTLADMPFICGKTYRKLISGFSEVTDICRPVYRGRNGHPVLFGRAYYPALRQMSGDSGAISVIEKNKKYLKRMDVEDRSVTCDIDYASQLKCIPGA